MPTDQQAKASVAARCAILLDAGRLCQFFGLKEANDFLLPQVRDCDRDGVTVTATATATATATVRLCDGATVIATAIATVTATATAIVTATAT
eukprot:4138068-Pyramimonas_sp.AAC.1